MPFSFLCFPGIVVQYNAFTMAVIPLNILPKVSQMSYPGGGGDQDMSSQIMQDLLRNRMQQQREDRSYGAKAWDNYSSFVQDINKLTPDNPFQQSKMAEMQQILAGASEEMRKANGYDALKIETMTRNKIYSNPEYAAAIREGVAAKEFFAAIKSPEIFKHIDQDKLQETLAEFYSPRNQEMTAKLSIGNLIMGKDKFADTELEKLTVLADEETVNPETGMGRIVKKRKFIDPATARDEFVTTMKGSKQVINSFNGNLEEVDKWARAKFDRGEAKFKMQEDIQGAPYQINKHTWLKTVHSPDGKDLGDGRKLKGNDDGTYTIYQDKDEVFKGTIAEIWPELPQLTQDAFRSEEGIDPGKFKVYKSGVSIIGSEQFSGAKMSTVGLNNEDAAVISDDKGVVTAQTEAEIQKDKQGNSYIRTNNPEVVKKLGFKVSVDDEGNYRLKDQRSKEYVADNKDGGMFWTEGGAAKREKAGGLVGAAKGLFGVNDPVKVDPNATDSPRYFNIRIDENTPPPPKKAAPGAAAAAPKSKYQQQLADDVTAGKVTEVIYDPKDVPPDLADRLDQYGPKEVDLQGGGKGMVVKVPNTLYDQYWGKKDNATPPPADSTSVAAPIDSTIAPAPVDSSVVAKIPTVADSLAQAGSPVAPVPIAPPAPGQLPAEQSYRPPYAGKELPKPNIPVPAGELPKPKVSVPAGKPVELPKPKVNEVPVPKAIPINLPEPHIKGNSQSENSWREALNPGNTDYTAKFADIEKREGVKISYDSTDVKDAVEKGYFSNVAADAVDDMASRFKKLIDEIRITGFTHHITRDKRKPHNFDLGMNPGKGDSMKGLFEVDNGKISGLLGETEQFLKDHGYALVIENNSYKDKFDEGSIYSNLEAGKLYFRPEAKDGSGKPMGPHYSFEHIGAKRKSGKYEKQNKGVIKR